MNKPLRKLSIKRIAILALSTAAAVLSLNYASGPSGAGSRVGASFSSGTCTASGCHTVSGSFNPTISVQLLSGTTPVTSYTPGNSYTLRVTLSSSGTSSSTRYGFQTVAVQTSNNNAVNAWGTLPSGTQTATISGRTHVEHSSPSTGNVFNIPWTAPTTANYSITFYAAGLVANGNNANTFDNMATGNLTVNPPCNTPSMNPSVTNVACFGQSTGAINLALTGGSSPFTFAWTGPSGYNSTSQNINGLAAGTYKVVVTATGGCKDSTTVTITEPSSALSLTASSNGPICAGTTLQLNSSATGGTGSVSYVWIGPNSFSSGSKDITLVNASTNLTGAYTVSATDANGCTKQQTINVEVDTSATVDSFTFSASPYNVITFNPVNRKGADSTLWIFGDGGTDTSSTPTHTYADGAYTVMLIVKNDCGSDTFSQVVTVQPVNVRSINRDNSLSIFPNPATDLVKVTTSGNAIIRTVNVYTLTGQVVSTNKVNSTEHTVNTSILPQGIYHISVATDKGVYTEKIEIIR